MAPQTVGDGSGGGGKGGGGGCGTGLGGGVNGDGGGLILRAHRIVLSVGIVAEVVCSISTDKVWVSDRLMKSNGKGCYESENHCE